MSRIMQTRRLGLITSLSIVAVVLTVLGVRSAVATSENGCLTRLSIKWSTAWRAS